MEITRQCVVALTWTLKDTLGEVLDVLDEPVEFLVGGGDLLAKIEDALQGHEPGATLDLHLEPEEAFGDYDPALVLLMPLENLGEGVEVGMRVEGDGGQGVPGRIFTITDIAEGMAVLDGNHPLAGFALRFEIAVIDVRGASAEELADAESTRLPEFLRLAEPRQTTLH